MHTHSEVVTIVNEVIETLNERESGYRIASENIKNAELQGVFSDFMNQSNRFISELMSYSDYQSPKEIGKGPLGTIYQGWMNFKEKITGGSVKSVLGDCLGGEEAAIKAYQTALKDEDLPSDLKNVLEGQYGEITAAKEKIKMLREQDF
jgi:uncharacterized protein (TIGR02284 family)